MDHRDKIMQIVRSKGPLLPTQIYKEVNTNSLFAGAMLSELVDKKKLKISCVKVGTSPLYYMEGQEYKLQNYYKQLHEKEQKAFDILKRELVLKDDEQAPVIRAALRAIKDFAKPLSVTYQDKKIIFWKWYLLEESKAVDIIKEKLNIKKDSPQIDPEAVNEIKKELEKEKAEKKEEEAEKEKSEGIKKAEHEEKPQEKTAQKDEREKEKEDKKHAEIRKPEKKPEQEKPFIDTTEKDDFYRKIERYFNKNDITIINSKIIRKDSEIDFIIEVPSAVGKLQYYCKAKNKKKSNEGDISSVFVKAQLKKLPALYITTGEVTKKALSMLKTDFSNISIKKI